MDRFIQPRVEPEIALVFGDDVTNPDEWERAVAYALLTVDILDSIYGGYRFQAADVVADNASGGAVIVGGQPLPADVLWRQEGSLRLSLDGGEWVEGALTDLGDPRALLSWAVQRIHSFERGLKRGDVLLLGGSVRRGARRRRHHAHRGGSRGNEPPSQVRAVAGSGAL